MGEVWRTKEGVGKMGKEEVCRGKLGELMLLLLIKAAVERDKCSNKGCELMWEKE